MATKNQIWYARSLKMLAKPTPVEDRSNNTGPTSGAVSEGQSQHLHSPSNFLDSNTDQEPQIAGPTRLEHNIDGQPVGNISVPAHFASTYLATMYPLSWTAADFDIFGPSSCRELFTDHDFETFGLDELPIGGMS